MYIIDCLTIPCIDPWEVWPGTLHTKTGHSNHSKASTQVTGGEGIRFSLEHLIYQIISSSCKVENYIQVTLVYRYFYTWRRALPLSLHYRCPWCPPQHTACWLLLSPWTVDSGQWTEDSG